MTKKQLAIDSIQDLLAMEEASGLQVSYDHIGSEWTAKILDAGFKVALKLQLAQGKNPVTLHYFPKGMPFGFGGDGSNDRSQREQEALFMRTLNAKGVRIHC
jgi:hypothetical protein